MAPNSPNSSCETLAEIESEILKIFEDCKAQGLTKEEIREIFAPLGMPKAVNKLTASPQKKLSLGRATWNLFKKNRKKVQGLLVGLMVVIVGIFVGIRNPEVTSNLNFHALAVTRIALIKVLPYWDWTDLYYSRCLMKNPFFEPPRLRVDDCNLCESLDDLPRLSNISQTEVLDDFIRREKPFIVTDGMDDWEIMNTDQFWFDNITEIYLKQDTYEVCSVNTNLRIPGRDFIRLLKKLYNPRTQEWFIHWENCQKDFAKAVRQYYKRPYFISNSLDFTGSNWVLMSSDFKGRVYKTIEVHDDIMMLYQLRGFNHFRLTPRQTCRGHCPELTGELREGEILVVTNLLWIFEYIPGEVGDNLALISEVSGPAVE